jgi:hypothetical protein
MQESVLVLCIAESSFSVTTEPSCETAERNLQVVSIEAVIFVDGDALALRFAS